MDGGLKEELFSQIMYTERKSGDFFVQVRSPYINANNIKSKEEVSKKFIIKYDKNKNINDNNDFIKKINKPKCYELYYSTYMYSYNNYKGKSNDALSLTELHFGCQGIASGYTEPKIHFLACEAGGSQALLGKEPVSCEIFSRNLDNLLR